MKLWDLYKGKDFDVKPTLERIKRAAEYTGNPQKNFPSVLIGGTNGKGSTCAFLERILRYHGLKTGWFISPHLIKENERWRINGKNIDDETLKDYVKDLKEVFKKFELTYFEAAVLIAIKYFSDMKVDFAVMEVGMGGRWDATKVCEPLITAITNVERDHTRWLGKNVEEIAEDKLHLKFEGVPIFLGNARYPLYTKALEMRIEDMVVAGIDYTYSSGRRGIRTTLRQYEFGNLNIEEAELGLLGKWQADNSALALSVASKVIKLDKEKTLKALRETYWEGRMEILREKPLLIVDGSHNPYAVGKVVKEIKRMFPDITFLFSGLVNKDWELSLELIRRYTDRIILTQVSYYRGESIRRLYEKAKELQFKEIIVLDSPADVWKLDMDVCALGSLYLIGEIKEKRGKID